MESPTEEEEKALQLVTKPHGFDFHDPFQTSSDDLAGWSKIFAVSADFQTYDRLAQVYGFFLYVAWRYYMDPLYGGGVKKFSGILNAQPPSVRQRVRDFLYADAIFAKQEDREALERNFVLRSQAFFQKITCSAWEIKFSRRLTTILTHPKIPLAETFAVAG
jgi:hypothetical protein